MPEVRKQRKKRKFLKAIIFFWLFFVFFAAIFYGLVFSPFLKIEKVSIEGAEKGIDETIRQIVDQKLAEKILGKIPVNNQVFLPDKEIADEILNRFSEIKAVNIEISLKEHSLKIDLQYRQPAAIWCRVLTEDNKTELNLPQPLLKEGSSISVSSTTDETMVSSESSGLPEAENCFFVDRDGFIFKSAPILSGLVPIVYEQASRNLNIKDTVSNPKVLQFILETKKQLDAANLNLTDFVILEQTVGNLEIVSPDGWKIFLNLDKSPTVQINALKRVLEEEIKDKRAQLDYVDLRVENRVYYKLKTS